MENFTTKLNFLLNESNEYASSLYNNEIETLHFFYVFFNSDLAEEKTYFSLTLNLVLMSLINYYLMKLIYFQKFLMLMKT